MITFKRLDKDVNIIKDYLEIAENEFCDLSLGCKYMWRDNFVIDYAIIEETLILKESCPDYENAFYYPIGKNVEKALNEIENYVKTENIPLKFCCIDNRHAVILSEMYPFANIRNDRNWSDYIYDAETFKTYSGKKMSGQRNHVNKFKRLYPNYAFKEIKKEDIKRIEWFLDEYDRDLEISMWTEREEQKKVLELVKEMENLNQVGGYIEVDDKIVAISVGEVVKDTLICHIEKGLKTYEGVYPTMANEFAKRFATGKVVKINREEDCGDMGLRISKLQYHPIEVKEKNIVEIETAITKIKPAEIKTERLTITDIEERDKKDYFDIYTDKELNEFWGYDYKTDLKEEPDTDYFYNFSKKLKETKEEYDFAVRKDGKMIGELCLYNFDYYGNAEIGFRIKKTEQKKGYAKESVKALIDYAKTTLKIKKIFVRCYKENIPSKNLIESLGFTFLSESPTQLFYVL